MNIKRLGNAVVVTSVITKALAVKAQTYNPDTLTVSDADGNEVYKVSRNNIGTVSPYSAKFDGYNTEGALTITLHIPQADNMVQQIKETFGNALAALAKYETIIVNQINEATASIDEIFAEVE